MKKSLLALAVLGAFAGVAQAQTNVTIYGVVDAGIRYTDNGASTNSNKWGVDSGMLNGSRLGFKGSEDLGGGLSAIFQIENGFNSDTGAAADAARLYNRQAWVGLQGGFGAVKLGRQNTPQYDNSGTFDPFANALAGDSARMISYAGSRWDNTLSYNYSAAGFRGQVQYAFGEVAGNTSAGRNVGGYVGYKNGPVDAVLLYTRSNNAAGTDDQRQWLLGGNYNFGVVKPYLTYSQTKGTGTLDQRDWLIGATAPVGPAGTIKASYIKKQDRSAANNAGARQWGIGYQHDLSKRTALYTSYGNIKNDSAATISGAATGVPAGATVKEFNVGMRHSF